MIKQNINKIVASSLNNDIVFYNDRAPRKVKITFYFIPNYDVMFGEETTFTIQDYNNPNDFTLVITGDGSAKVTATSFNTSDNKDNMLLSLASCLRLNSGFFSNVRVFDDEVTAYIDTSRQYTFRLGNMIGMSAKIDYYNVASTPKYGLQFTDEEGNTFINEKYSTNDEVIFNATAPFELMPFKYPTKYILDAYSIVDDRYTFDIKGQEMTVLPTTLHKFDDFNVNEYLYNEEITSPKMILTNNINRVMRYGERVAFSVLENDVTITFKGLYYTNSGQYIGESELTPYTHYTEPRMDVVLAFDIDDIERQYGRNVGYIKVRLLDGGQKPMYEDLVLKYKPICKDNYELFFLNELGGIDSFNFTDSYQSESKISNAVNYISNKRPQGDIMEIEGRKQLQYQTSHTLTAKVDKVTGEWLREMAKSKWVYYIDDEGRNVTVIIDTMTIKLNDKDSSFTVSVEYHRSDNALMI